MGRKSLKERDVSNVLYTWVRRPNSRYIPVTAGLKNLGVARGKSIYKINTRCFTHRVVIPEGWCRCGVKAPALKLLIMD